MKGSLFILASALAVSAANHFWNSTLATKRTLHARADDAMVVNLGTAIGYTILAETGISTVPVSQIQGNIGVSPAAAGALTGFDPLVLSTSGAYATSVQVSGRVYAASYNAPTPGDLTTAVTAMQAAYTAAMGETPVDFSEYQGGALGGSVLIPGIYKFSTTVNIATDLTLTGTCDDIYVFQIAGTLTQTAGTHVTLTGGLLASRVFWAVADTVSIGAAADFQGIILAKTDVTLVTGASLTGRIYAQTAVALQQAIVIIPPAYNAATCTTTTTTTTTGTTPTTTGTTTGTTTATTTGTSPTTMGTMTDTTTATTTGTTPTTTGTTTGTTIPTTPGNTPTTTGSTTGATTGIPSTTSTTTDTTSGTTTGTTGTTTTTSYTATCTRTGTNTTSYTAGTTNSTATKTSGTCTRTRTNTMTSVSTHGTGTTSRSSMQSVSESQCATITRTVECTCPTTVYKTRTVTTFPSHCPWSSAAIHSTATKKTCVKLHPAWSHATPTRSASSHSWSSQCGSSASPSASALAGSRCTARPTTRKSNPTGGSAW